MRSRRPFAEPAVGQLAICLNANARMRGGAVPVRLATVLVGRRGMLLSAVVASAIVMVRGLAVMMRSRLMMGRGAVVVLARSMLFLESSIALSLKPPLIKFSEHVRSAAESRRDVNAEAVSARHGTGGFFCTQPFGGNA